jgi:hypothetical protein
MLVKNLVLVSTLLVLGVSVILLTFGNYWGCLGMIISIVSSTWNKYI